MRRRDRYGYHTYYGGGGPSPVIKVIVIVLAVVVLSLILTILGLRQYMVYSDGGGKLVLPWSQQTSEKDEKKPAKDTQEQKEQKKDKDDAAASSQAPVEEEPAPENPAVTAVRVSQEDLMSGKVTDILERYKANGAVLEMKAPSGQLSYISDQKLATVTGSSWQAKASAEEDEREGDPVADAIRKFKEDHKDTYLIAYVDCFEDELVGKQEEYAILTHSGYRWRGPNDEIRWGSPSNADVRAYLVGIVGELADMGFDEIMLYNAGYPTDGHLNYIRKDEAYDETQFANVIGDFYTEAAKAANDKDARLSVVTKEDTILSGVDEVSGQTLVNLASLDRVWLERGGNPDVKALSEKLTGAGMNRNPVGVLTKYLQKDKDFSQAVVEEK